MTEWEKNLQKHIGRRGYRTRWVRTGRGSVFFLAWKGKEVQILFVDLEDILPKASSGRVKEEYLELLSRLIRDPEWEGIFKGREVLFKWVTGRSALEDGVGTLESAGVERFYFPRSEEGRDEGTAGLN